MLSGQEDEPESGSLDLRLEGIQQRGRIFKNRTENRYPNSSPSTVSIFDSKLDQTFQRTDAQEETFS